MSWEWHLPDGDVSDAFFPGEHESLARAWGRHFTASPERKAVRQVDDERWLTYGDLDAGSRVAAARLAAAGLRPGERIVISALASLDLVVAYVAALRLGLVVVPLNTAFTKREFDYVLDDVRPAGAIVDDPKHSGWVQRVGVVCTTQINLPEGPDIPLDRSMRDDLALIAYTSGTTGSPKGAMLSHGNLLSSAEAVRTAWRWTKDDCLLLSLPLFHVHGLCVGLLGTLVAGASALLAQRFDADAIIDIARTERASMFFGVPTMYSRLLASPHVVGLSRLRLCVSGSAPLPEEVHLRFSEAVGQGIIERYGMTETVMNVSNPYDAERRAGTVGFPLPGVRIRLASDDEILVSGPNVFRGYWELPAATSDAFDDEGWFRTGDLGEFDSDGYLRIKGRKKDLIITGGYNVYPQEVEAVLRSHPHVTDAAVAGFPSADLGEVVIAWVVPDGHLVPEDVVAYAASKLVRYKQPREVYVVDDLPRNALGKVLRHELHRTA